MGIGGSVIFRTKRGSARPDGSENPYFTVSVLGSLGLALLVWAGLLWLEGPILTFLGADEGLLVLARRYLRPVKFVFPLFLFNQMLAAFLVSVARGLVLSGILILILLCVTGSSARRRRLSRISALSTPVYARCTAGSMAFIS